MTDLSLKVQCLKASYWNRAELTTANADKTLWWTGFSLWSLSSTKQQRLEPLRTVRREAPASYIYIPCKFRDENRLRTIRQISAAFFNRWAYALCTCWGPNLVSLVSGDEPAKRCFKMQLQQAQRFEWFNATWGMNVHDRTNYKVTVRGWN